MSDTPQKTALFNPFNGHLEQLFSYIDVGDLGLPDIQRPFVWRDAKVRDLFDSLYRGFPIGSYLLWRNTANGRTHQIGAKEHEHKDPNLLIIDGQQRLTALYSVFRGVAVKDENYEDRIMTIAFNPITEEFRVADAATQRNPEFINNITDLFSKASTRTFINQYLEKLRKEKDNLKKKHLLILKKIDEKEELNKGDVELFSDKIKSSDVFDQNRIIWEKLCLTEKEPVENEEEKPNNHDSISAGAHSFTLTSPGYQDLVIKASVLASQRLVISAQLGAQDIIPTPTPTPLATPSATLTPGVVEITPFPKQATSSALPKPYVEILATPDNNHLKVRSENVIGNNIIAIVNTGDKFPYVSTSGSWYQIEYLTGKKGYVSTTYAKLNN